VCAFRKLPWKSNLNHESLSLLIRWLKNYISFSLQQFTHNRTENEQKSNGATTELNRATTELNREQSCGARSTEPTRAAEEITHARRRSDESPHLLPPVKIRRRTRTTAAGERVRPWRAPAGRTTPCGGPKAAGDMVLLCEPREESGT
jgi:hypothetical protein